MGTTVIGSYPGYIALSDRLGARRFDLGAHVWAALPPNLRWPANRHFLDQVINANDSFVLSTDPRLVRPGSWLFRELRYLAVRNVAVPYKRAWTQ